MFIAVSLLMDGGNVKASLGYKVTNIITGVGTGESGKSTFIKQMRIIHGAGYTEEDRKGYTGQVHSNIFMAIKALVLAMNQLSIRYENSANLVNPVVIMCVLLLLLLH